MTKRASNLVPAACGVVYFMHPGGFLVSNVALVANLITLPVVLGALVYLLVHGVKRWHLALLSLVLVASPVLDNQFLDAPLLACASFVVLRGIVSCFHADVPLSSH